MSPDILILRPESGASATVAKAQALGFATAHAPLFEVMPLDWPPADPDAYDAVMMTSAHAARLAGPLLPAYLHLPLYAVGAATAQAARDAGFTTIHTGQGDVEALVADMADHGVSCALHLAGAEHRAPHNAWMKIDRRIVYEAREIAPVSALPEARFILVHSPRAGARLAELIPDAEREERMLVAISAMAAEAAGTGWRAVLIAAHPRDDDLLECVQRACKRGL
jgi:uroporphyrinogen-III synthase